jgi:hypothetical protein
MQQRPSRHVVRELTKRAGEMKEKGVVVVAVQASKVDDKTLNDWVEKSKIPFLVGMVEEDAENTRFNWGVKSLPWLILTDASHVVTAEGFSLDDLDQKIKVQKSELKVLPQTDQPPSEASAENTAGSVAQLREMLQRRYAAAKSVTKDIRIIYQIKQWLHPQWLKDWGRDPNDQVRYILEEYLQKKGKERHASLYGGASAPEEHSVSASPSVDPNYILSFDVFDGQYGLHFLSTRHGGDSSTKVGRAEFKASDKDLHAANYAHRGFAKFFGYRPGLMPDDVLASPQLKIEPRSETIDGLQTYKISAPFEINRVMYVLSYWLVPHHSSLPVKMELRETDGTLKMEMKTTDFMNLKDGRWVIKETVLTDLRTEKEGGPHKRGTWTFTVKRLQLQPRIDEQKVFNASIDILPAGTLLVVVDNNEAVEYVVGEGPIYTPACSLVGKTLPPFHGIDIDFGTEQAKGKKVLVCFWDMNQRPSRHCVRELAKRAQPLEEERVVVVCVQASKLDKMQLDEWIEELGITFTLGMVQGDEEQTKFNWGVRFLPWLILADKDHIVRAEGFGTEELAEKIKQSQASHEKQ